MKFPLHVKHRKAEAVIYAKSKNYAFYRVIHYSSGKRIIRSFKTYNEAKTAAKKTVRDLAKGSQASALSASQARDAIAAFERLEAYHRTTGRKVSLNAAVGEFVEVSSKLEGVTLTAAVDGFLNSVASVRRTEVSKVVAEFISARTAKTLEKDGKRAQLSANYAGMTAAWLRDFSAAFPATSVADLTKAHLDTFMAERGKKLGARTRNHIRATVRMFLGWCVRKDYLPLNHRLFDADSMAKEIVETEETDFYRPEELRVMLETAAESLRPIVALCALAGLRLQEALRLTWKDVFGSPGHITITATKSKTRQRRLVEVCASLAEWLRPFRAKEGSLWPAHRDTFHAQFTELREGCRVRSKEETGDGRKIPVRKNGLRHGFCTYHFALYSNENLTAAQAGNSPSIIHAHYKGLATKAEAQEWFAVAPATTDVPATKETASKP